MSNMVKLGKLEVVSGKSFKIYRENVQAILDEIVENKGAKIIYEDLYKDSKKQSLYGIYDREVLYRTNENTFYLVVSVTGDSYLSQMGISIEENECIVQFDEDEAIDYLESKGESAVILKNFSNKLIAEKQDVLKPAFCYIKNRKVYDIKQSYSLKLYTDKYIRYGEEIVEYEELLINRDEIFFLQVLCDSVRTVNSHLYFRNKEAGEREKDDILPMSEEEAIKWYLHRGGTLEEFYRNVEDGKLHLRSLN